MKPWGAIAFLLAALPPRTGVAANGPPRTTTTLALLVGVNRSMDPGVAPLRYADDDAVRYRDLFRAIGARTVTLARLDENTRRLHPEVAADVRPARLDLLLSAVEHLAREAAQARRAGAHVAFYFVYAGHGRVEEGEGRLALEDAELGGAYLARRVIDRIGAHENHLIVDACHSYYLVLGRGPGGRRRPMRGFVELGELARRPEVGLLLSTSSARESHEWAAYQAGVFSHAVRSGLYGAADADGDGRIGYAEIGAFVERASAAIRNERYRPEVYPRPPAGRPMLLDLRPALARRIEVAPGGGHQYIEDTAGVRWADFHNDAPLRLVRPGAGPLYLRRRADDREIVLPPDVAVLDTAALPLVEPRSSVRDAANDAFTSLFAMPFGSAAVSGYVLRDELGIGGAAPPAEGRSWWPRPGDLVGWTLIAAGAVAGAWGAETLLDARALRESRDPGLSQEEAGGLNRQIGVFNQQGTALLGAGIAAAAGGLFTLLWQERPGGPKVDRPGRKPSGPRLDLVVAPGAVAGGIRGTF